MSQSGFIYAIGAEGTPHVKIGSTKGSVESRRRQLQTGHPLRLQTVASIAVDMNLRAIEKQVQTFLVEYLQGGEWFDVPMDPERLEALVTRAVQECAAPAQHVHRQVPGAEPQTFGERISILRRRRGMTQQELATLAQITANTLARVERGSVKMLRGDTVALLADALGTTTDYLLGHTEESGVEPDLVGAGTL